MIRTLALTMLLVVVGAGSAHANEVAVVVNGDTPVDALSFADLRKVMRGERQFWAAGKPVTLLVHSPSTAERQVLLGKIFEMSEAQFKQYWIAKVFRAEATSGPKVVLSNQMAAELLKVIPGAIALVDSAQVAPGMKVIPIDGKKPGDSGYPLR